MASQRVDVFFSTLVYILILVLCSIAALILAWTFAYRPNQFNIVVISTLTLSIVAFTSLVVYMSYDLDPEMYRGYLGLGLFMIFLGLSTIASYVYKMSFPKPTFQ